ncbi:MAG TPA: ADOP family duplicated permease, partial [Acidobacteriota bacterium]
THPLLPEEDPAQFRDRHYLDVIGRLKPGVRREQAAAQLDVLGRRLERQYPDANRGKTIGIFGLKEDRVFGVRPTLLTLLAAVGFVLLIACANVANLLLARGAVREKELAIRAALGAGRGRIVRQLLTESVLLALLGGAAAVMLALWLTPLLLALAPADLQALEGAPAGASVNLPVLAFALLLSALSGVLFGLTPALQSARLDLGRRLKEGSRGTERKARARTLLVAAEIALSLVLLVGAGLMVRSFARLLEVRPGFQPDRLLVFSLTAPPTQSSERQVAQYQAIVERLRSLPGVAAAGAVSRLPLSRGNSARSFNLAGGDAEYEADLRVATGDYFRTLGIPLIQGRDFSAHDVATAPAVAVVNQALARRVFSGRDPLGQRFWFFPEQPIEIVGVVGNVRHHGLASAPRPEVYLPLAQSYWPSMTVAMRSAGRDPLALVPAAQRAIWSLDPEMPLAELKTMDRVVSDSLEQRRFSMLLLALFASVALLLAAVGLYGAVAYAVSQRTREFAIRMALGALPRQVVRMILGQALRITLAGLACGIAAALGLTHLIAGL